MQGVDPTGAGGDNRVINQGVRCHFLQSSLAPLTTARPDRLCLQCHVHS